MPTRVLTFTETATGVTYTAKCSLPPGSRLLDVLIETTVAWTAATAPLDVGDSDAADALVQALNVAAQDFTSAGAKTSGTAWGDSGGNGSAYLSSGSGKLYPSGATITAVISPTVPGGPTGVSRVTLWFEQPQSRVYVASVV